MNKVSTAIVTIILIVLFLLQACTTDSKKEIAEKYLEAITKDAPPIDYSDPHKLIKSHWRHLTWNDTSPNLIVENKLGKSVYSADYRSYNRERYFKQKREYVDFRVKNQIDKIYIVFLFIGHISPHFVFYGCIIRN